jgi:hypothetical protein
LINGSKHYIGQFPPTLKLFIMDIWAQMSF